MGQPLTLEIAPTVPCETYRHFSSELGRIDALESAAISIDPSANAECPDRKRGDCLRRGDPCGVVISSAIGWNIEFIDSRHYRRGGNSQVVSPDSTVEPPPLIRHLEKLFSPRPNLPPDGHSPPRRERQVTPRQSQVFA